MQKRVIAIYKKDVLNMLIGCFIVFSINCCTSEKYVEIACPTSPLVPDTLLIPEKYYKILEKGGRLNTDYGFKIITINSIDYLTCLLAKNKQIVGFQLNDTNKIISWNFNLPLFNNNRYHSNFFVTSPDKLFFICINNNWIYNYEWTNTRVNLIDSSKIMNFDTTTFFSMNYGSNAEIANNADNSFKITFNYGIIKNPKGNYVDTSNLIEISENGEVKKIGKYPPSFKNEYKPYYHSLFKTINDSLCVTTYLLDNYIYIVNKKNNVIVKQGYIGNPQTKNYDKSRIQDIGYLRNYLVENGLNRKIEAVDENNIVVLKRLPGKLIDTIFFYKYLLLDKNLNIKFCNTIKQSVSPYFLQKHKKGFFLMGARYDRLFYYRVD